MRRKVAVTRIFWSHPLTLHTTPLSLLFTQDGPELAAAADVCRPAGFRNSVLRNLRAAGDEQVSFISVAFP